MPNFFWDSEPTLHPLYEAVREYLEIDPRIKVLNERCRVFLDLAEILSDSVADAKMSAITWIIIILIVISILVTATEVGLRFGMLSKNSDKGKGKAAVAAMSWAGGVSPVTAPQLVVVPPSPPLGQASAGRYGPSATGPGHIEVLALALGLQANSSVEDIRQGIVDLRRKVAAPAARRAI